MTATLAPARPESAAGRTTFVALTAREMHRFVVNPVFLFAVVMTAWTTWDDRKAPATAVGTGNWFPWIFLGGFGMMATFWLTRSMRDSEPVVGVTPTTLPARTASGGRGRAFVGRAGLFAFLISTRSARGCTGRSARGAGRRPVGQIVIRDSRPAARCALGAGCSAPRSC